MIGKLSLVAIASLLALAGSAAHAVETTARPKLLNCSVPDYPLAWINEELQGTVGLAVLVSADGSVKDAKVVESSGRRALDKASVRASSTCKFGAASEASGNASGWTNMQYKWVTE